MKRRRGVVMALLTALLVVLAAIAWNALTPPSEPRVEIVSLGELSSHRSSGEHERTVLLRLVNDTAQDYYYYGWNGPSPAPYLYGLGASGWHEITPWTLDGRHPTVQMLPKGASVEFTCAIRHPGAEHSGLSASRYTDFIIGVSGASGAPPASPPVLDLIYQSPSTPYKILQRLKSLMGLRPDPITLRGVLPHGPIWSRKLDFYEGTEKPR